MIAKPLLVCMLTQSYLEYFRPTMSSDTYRWGTAFLSLGLYAFVLLTGKEEDQELWSRYWDRS